MATMTIEGLVREGRIVLPPNLVLPEGATVRILVEPSRHSVPLADLVQLNSEASHALWDNQGDTIYDTEDWR